jgi:hypothetical protein
MRGREITALEKQQQSIIMETGRRLAAWPSARELFGDLERLPRPEVAQSTSREHEMCYIQGNWRCRICNYTPHILGAIPKTRKRCLGRSAGRMSKLLDMQEHQRGHRLISATTHSSQMEIVWCIRCGAYMHTNPRQLAKTCRGTCGPTEKWRLRALSAGIHPFSGESLSDFHYLARLGWVDNLDTLAGDFIAAEEVPVAEEVVPLAPYTPGRISRRTVTTGPGSEYGSIAEMIAAMNPADPEKTERAPEPSDAQASALQAEVDDLNTR